jgi:hypothetical protein
VPVPISTTLEASIVEAKNLSSAPTPCPIGFSPNSLGMSVNVYHVLTKNELDVTDYKSW